MNVSRDARGTLVRVGRSYAAGTVSASSPVSAGKWIDISSQDLTQKPPSLCIEVQATHLGKEICSFSPGTRLCL